MANAELMTGGLLTALLAEKYGLSNITLTPAPRGFVAETYYVDSTEGRYFAKIAKVAPDSEHPGRALPVLRELHRLGVERITYPIPTTDGQDCVYLGDKILVLFNYLAGEWVFEFPLEPYVELLAKVHQLSAHVQAPLTHETFELWFKSDLFDYLNRLGIGTFSDAHEQAMADWTLSRRDDIKRDFAILEETIADLKSSDNAFVLTHGDAAGNVLYDGEQIALVDWDTALFAPRERDTWFHLHDERFLPAYRQFVPGYEFDRVACRFYLYRRYFEDMLGYFEKVLSPDSTNTQKRDNLHELYKTCDDWLRPLMDAENASG